MADEHARVRILTEDCSGLQQYLWAFLSAKFPQTGTGRAIQFTQAVTTSMTSYPVGSNCPDVEISASELNLPNDWCGMPCAMPG
jgi:hypothetical protein